MEKSFPGMLSHCAEPRLESQQDSMGRCRRQGRTKQREQHEREPDVTDEPGERQAAWSVRVCAGVWQRWSWELGAGPRVQAGRVVGGVFGKLDVLESNREP